MVRPNSYRGTWRNAVAGVLLAAAALAWSLQPGFSTAVSAVLVDHYALRFGEESRARLIAWQGFLKGQAAEARVERELADLAAVNTYFNRVRFVSDFQHWSVADYWATPAEFIASYGGDCEDYALAKYFALKELGVPIERMRITYVTSTLIKEAHMVLAYYPTPQSDPLILDNFIKQIRPASQRPDLTAVYAFNDEDALTAGGWRAVLQVRSWRDLRARLDR